MFDADPTIDRPSVELCAELFTDDVMVDVANRPVKGYELALYRRHPSGIDRWYPHSVPVAARANDSTSGPETAEEPEVVAEVGAPDEPNVEPQEMTLFQPTIEHDEPNVEPSPEEPKNKLDAPPITLAVPVTRPVAITTPPPPMATQPLPVTPLVTTQLPAVARTVPTAPLVAAPPLPSSNEVDASSIADEVAEAIKRAFAGLGG
jgi:hypothetical protein